MTLPAGKNTFTWGSATGSDIVGDPPGGNTPDGGVITWSYLESGVEVVRGAPNSIYDYQGYPQKDTPGSPPVILWQNRSVGGSAAEFIVLPIPSEEVTLRLYGRVPSLRRIVRTGNYDLPDGVAGYISLSLAVYLAPHFGMPISNELTVRLRDSERGLVQLARSRFRPRLGREYTRIGRGSRYGFIG